MTLFKGRRRCGRQQPFFSQVAESVETLSIYSNQLSNIYSTQLSTQRSGQRRNFTRKAGLVAGSVAGSVTVAVGAASPAYANPNASQPLLGEPVQSGQVQSGQGEPSQSLVDQVQDAPWQREQARIEKLRRLQAGIRSERRFQAEAFRASQYAQTQYEYQFEQPVADGQPAPAQTADGVYLYGQQPVPNQLATAYFVFEAQGDMVTGAFYMPSSSFDCVQGRIDGQQMALNVTDSYSQETTGYALALAAPNSQVASLDSVMATPPNISGYHALSVSDRDRDLLATCQARY